jgi:hypothetical protein
MIEMGDKEQSREMRDEIRSILMSEWDPIGVNDTPEAADEYDGYVGPVLDLLNAKASSDEIAAYLRNVETERMGLTDAQGKPLLPAQDRNRAVHSLKHLIPHGRIRGKVASPRGHYFGVISIVLAVVFWIYATSSGAGPNAFTQNVYVIFVLLPGVLIASAIAAILAAFWGSKWWLCALLGSASGALLMLTASV